MHICSAKQLETELSDTVAESDLETGSQVIWRYKGLPYAVEIQEVFGTGIAVVAAWIHLCITC